MLAVQLKQRALNIINKAQVEFNNGKPKIALKILEPLSTPEFSQVLGINPSLRDKLNKLLDQIAEKL